jgi:predicted permease
MQKQPKTFLGIFRRRKHESETNDEIQFHLEKEVELNIARGMAPEEARRQALIAFGGVQQTREAVREVHRLRFFDVLLQDLRYALRMLRKNPMFTVITLGVLMIGIGANTAIFSVIDVVLIKMLPVKNPQELVSLSYRDSRGREFEWFSYPVFQHIRDRNEVFAGVIASETGIRKQQISFNGPRANTEAETANIKLISGTYFPVLGVSAVFGRTLTTDDDKVSGASPVAVISYGYWKRRLGLDPAVLGRTFTVQQSVFTIVGVAPPEFFGESVGESPDIWLPLSMQGQLDNEENLNAPNISWLEMIARLKPDVSPQKAAASMSVLLQQINRELMGPKEGSVKTSVELKSASKGLDALRQRFSQPLRILMGVVALVLLVACISVASLLAARATARHKEIAVRATLGASSRRLLQQLLTESTLLAIMGGALGLLFMWWMNHLLPALLFDRDTLLNLELNRRVLAFSLLVSLVTGILFGLAPALQVLRPNLAYSLKDDRAGSRRLRFGLRRILVVAQVALSILLLVVAGLLVRSLQKLKDVDLGFNKENLLLVRLAPGSDLGPQKLKAVYQDVLEKVGALPAVKSCSLSLSSFADGDMSLGPIVVEGYAPRAGEDATLHATIISPGFLGTMGIPLLEGRDFRPQDNSTVPGVAIVNETFAHYYFGNASPLGKHLAMGRLDRRPLKIIGVARDAKYGGLKEHTSRFYYTSLFQQDEWLAAVRLLEVRTLADPAAVASEVRDKIGSISSSLRVDEIKTMTAQVADSMRQQSMLAELSSSFGLFALLLACVGLYGLMSYVVTCRTNEIGIRMALGAERAHVLWMMLREGFLLALIGVGIGVPAALAAGKLASSLISGLLFQVQAGDPQVIAASAVVMILVALVAGYLPARRAAKTDPLQAIRYE